MYYSVMNSPILQRLQEAETRNQELSHSVTSATRPLLRQIENLQATLGAQTASWEKLEKNISDRLGERSAVARPHLLSKLQSESEIFIEPRGNFVCFVYTGTIVI